MLLIDVEMPGLGFGSEPESAKHLCPQTEPLYPVANAKVAQTVLHVLDSHAFLDRAVAALSGAVQIATETYDTLPPLEKDPNAWKEFASFHLYLKKTFPLVHDSLKLTTVNTCGLVYEWTGSDTDLKPVLLAAHQDVVPVNPATIDQWTHPPFSGYFDGEWIWGRGSSDDKLGLISILLAIETLLSHKFQPTRTVVLAFGFDEEISGTQGAGKIAPYLEETYGRNSFAFLVDEGAGLVQQYGALFAAPGIGEKGYFDVRVDVTTAGGHSSIPPANHHTGIGILSQLIVIFENNVITPRLSRKQPIYESLKCLGAHAPDIPQLLKRAIKRSMDSDRDLHRVEEMIFKDNYIKSTVATTQAVTMVNGGVKANALPEQSWAIINTRIATDSSVAAVMDHYTTLVKDYAIFNNITFKAFGKTILDRGNVISIELSDAWGTALEPAPITPTDAAAYKLLSGTILATEVRGGNTTESSDPVYVMPSMMTGNTDTRRYWNLTPNIFRYNHLIATEGANIHTVDEHVKASGLIRGVRFYAYLLLNSDESVRL